jgi:hypothetical protein
VHVAGRSPAAFPGAMALANNGCAVCLHGKADTGNIDGEKRAAVLTGKDAPGLNRLPAPAVKPEDPVGFRDGVPALEIGQLPSIGRASRCACLTLACDSA